MKKNNKLLKNKRGEDMLVDFWAILVFALVVVLFFILFKVNKNDNETTQIASTIQSKDIDYMLNSFLRAPAIGIDNKKTVSDIIIEDYYSNNYARTETLFKQFYSQTTTIRGNKINDIDLEIVSSNNPTFNSEILMEGGTSTAGKLLEVIVKDYDAYKTSTSLPVYNGMVFVHINIFAWKTEKENNK
jgi:hypothetical protein